MTGEPEQPRPAARPAGLLPRFALPLLVAVLAGLVVAGLVMLLRDSDEPEMVVVPTWGTTPAEVAANPEAYYGQTVNVTGTIVETLGPNLVRLGTPEQPDATILVHAAEPLAETLADNGLVFVVGEVQRLPVVGARPDLPEDLVALLQSDPTAEPLLLATSVEAAANR